MGKTATLAEALGSIRDTFPADFLPPQLFVRSRAVEVLAAAAPEVASSLAQLYLHHGGGEEGYEAIADAGLEFEDLLSAEGEGLSALETQTAVHGELLATWAEDAFDSELDEEEHSLQTRASFALRSEVTALLNEWFEGRAPEIAEAFRAIDQGKAALSGQGLSDESHAELARQCAKHEAGRQATLVAHAALDIEELRQAKAADVMLETASMLGAIRDSLPDGHRASPVEFSAERGSTLEHATISQFLVLDAGPAAAVLGRPPLGSAYVDTRADVSPVAFFYAELLDPTLSQVIRGPKNEPARQNAVEKMVARAIDEALEASDLSLPRSVISMVSSAGSTGGHNKEGLAQGPRDYSAHELLKYLRETSPSAAFFVDTMTRNTKAQLAVDLLKQNVEAKQVLDQAPQQHANDGGAEPSP